LKSLICALVLAALSFTAHAEEPALKTVYDGSFTTAPKIRVHAQIPEAWNDPGEFSKLTLYKNGKEALKMDDVQASTLDQKSFPDEAEKIKNFMVVFPQSAKSIRKLLAFAHWRGASHADELILVDLSLKKPKVIFRKSEHFKEVRDYNGDGLYDLIKPGGNGESSDKDSYAYDPYLIYKQSRKNGQAHFELDEMLSKKFSHENKFEWRGPAYDSKILVRKTGELVK